MCKSSFIRGLIFVIIAVPRGRACQSSRSCTLPQECMRSLWGQHRGACRLLLPETDLPGGKVLFKLRRIRSSWLFFFLGFLWVFFFVCSDPEKIQPVERAAKAILEETREQVRDCSAMDLSVCRFLPVFLPCALWICRRSLGRSSRLNSRCRSRVLVLCGVWRSTQAHCRSVSFLVSWISAVRHSHIFCHVVFHV